MPVICCWSRLQGLFCYGRPGTQHVCLLYRMGKKKHYVSLVYISQNIPFKIKLRLTNVKLMAIYQDR
jgi:hypothetical protein